MRVCVCVLVPAAGAKLRWAEEFSMRGELC